MSDDSQSPAPPTPPAVEPTPAPKPTSSKGAMVWGETPSENERLFAVGAHLGWVVLPIAPFVPALVIWYLKKDESKFVAYHALQSAVLQLVVLVLGTVTCGVGLVLALGSIMGALKAYEGAWWGYPGIDGIGKNG